MKMRSVALMRVAKSGYIVMSLFFCVSGILLIAKPDVSTKLLGVALGITLIGFGVIKWIGFFSKDLFRLAFQYDLELGALLTVLGIVVLARPNDVLNILSVAVGLSILTEALFKARIAFDAKRFGIRSWWAILTLSIVSGMIGILLAVRPWESAKYLTILLGISFLSVGILNLCVALCTVKIIKNQYPDYIDVDYREMEDEIK